MISPGQTPASRLTSDGIQCLPHYGQEKLCTDIVVLPKKSALSEVIFLLYT